MAQFRPEPRDKALLDQFRQPKTGNNLPTCKSDGTVVVERGVTDHLAETILAYQLEVKRLREALEIIAGRRQCVNNLMSNVDVAVKALDK